MRRRGWGFAMILAFFGGGALAAPAPPAPVGGNIGADGPLVVEGVAPDRRWTAICQAREDTDGDGAIDVMVGYHGDTYGDDLRPYLVVGDGPGRPIDAYVDATTDGRWVALVERGRLFLWDSRADRRLDLTTRGAVSPATHHALFSSYGGFAYRSHRFLYFRDDPAHDGLPVRRRAVVIDADTGGEQVIDHGADVLFSAYLHEGGRHATVFIHAAGAGVLLPRTSLAGRQCRGPVSSYSTGGGSNLDAGFVRVAGPAWSGRLLAIIDGDALVRSEAGELVWDHDGRRARALPDGVDGRVYGVGRSRGVVIAVPVDGQQSEIRWYGPAGAAVATGWILKTPPQDYGSLHDRIWWHWGDDRLTWLLDTETGAYMTAPFESDVEGDADGNVFLMRRSDGWAAIADLAKGTVTDLPLKTSPYANHGRRGPWAFAKLDGGGNVVVDVARGRVAGFVGGPEALALATDGLLLTSTAYPGLTVSNRLPLGPLRWYRPGALADAP